MDGQTFIIACTDWKLCGIVPQNQRRAMGDLGLVQKEQTGESGVKIERKMHILEKRVTPLSSDCLTDS